MLNAPPASAAAVEGLGNDGYLPLKRLAIYAGMSVRTLRGYLSHPGRPLPHYRVGGKLLVRRSEFDTWIQAFRTTVTSRVDVIVAEVLRKR